MKENSNITTVKYQADIKTPTEYTGYLVDGKMSVPMEEGNRHYREVQEWIAEGNVPDEAFTAQELIDYDLEKALSDANKVLADTNHLMPNDIEAELTPDEIVIRDTARQNAIKTINTGLVAPKTFGYDVLISKWG